MNPATMHPQPMGSQKGGKGWGGGDGFRKDNGRDKGARDGGRANGSQKGGKGWGGGDGFRKDNGRDKGGKGWGAATATGMDHAQDQNSTQPSGTSQYAGRINDRKESLLKNMLVDINYNLPEPDLFPEELDQHIPKDDSSVTVTRAEVTIPKLHEIKMFHLPAQRGHKRLGHLLLMTPKDANNASKVKIKFVTCFYQDVLDQKQQILDHVLGTCRTDIILQVLGTKDLNTGCVQPLELHEETNVELELIHCRHESSHQPEKLDAALHDRDRNAFLERIYKGEHLQVKGKGRHFSNLALWIARIRQIPMPEQGERAHQVNWEFAEPPWKPWAPGDLFEIRFSELTLFNNPKRESLHGKLVLMLPSNKHCPFDHPQEALVVPVAQGKRSFRLVFKAMLHPVDCPAEFLEDKKQYKVHVAGEGGRGIARLCPNPKFGQGKCWVRFEDGSVHPFDPQSVEYQIPERAKELPGMPDDNWDAATLVPSEMVSEATGAGSSTQAYPARAQPHEQIPEVEPILEDDVEILFYDPKIVDKPTRAVVIEFGQAGYQCKNPVCCDKEMTGAVDR